MLSDADLFIFSIYLSVIHVCAGSLYCTDARTVSQWERQRRQSVRRKKSQWTIICVACGFFTSCLLLVAGMLSITSEYQVTQIFLSFGSYNFYIF